MSLRTLGLSFVLAVTAACSGGGGASNEPTTAKEKQRQDAAAAGEADEPTGKGKGWRYAGERDACFFVVGHRCFKSEDAACKFARCGARKCTVDGGGPATVACAK